MLYSFFIILTNIIIYMLLAQAILSWFVNPNYSRGGFGPVAQVYRVLSSLTYPLTLPARAILARFNTGPIDFSLLLTMLFIYVIRRVLYVLF